MVYSEKNQGYKFPGGGIQRGESHEVALTREVREETGMQVVGRIAPYGKIIEYDLPIEKEFDVFKMTSYYYWCRVGKARNELNLDQYEKELGFLPVWVEIDAAIRRDISLLQDPHQRTPRWVRRELEVLQQIKTLIISGAA